MWFSQKKKSIKSKVKIVAVAKDEGAYLPEWVFHHLYLGFDAIDIYVNRTTDNSSAMLRAISNVYPTVNAFDADWVDESPKDIRDQMQYVIYEKAFRNIREKGEFDYVLFIDIDEFWTPYDLDMDIHDVIKKNLDASCIAFNWINQYGSEQEFSSIQQKIFGTLHFLVKSLVRVDSDIVSIRLHRPNLKIGKTVLMDGTPFKAGSRGDETLDESLIFQRPAMIVHRMFRSPMEYISLLNKGRPSSPTNIKLNRGGYNISIGNEICFELNELGFNKYHRAKQDFLANEEIAHELNIAKEFVKKRYLQTLENVSSVPFEHYSDLIRVFTGCGDLQYSHVLNIIMQSENTMKSKDTDWLIKLASHIEKQNKSAALELWNKALILRPNGPRILKKLDEYRKNNIV